MLTTELSLLLLFYHYFHSIDKRRREVMERRQKAGEKADSRRDALGDSLAFQEFKRDTSEVS